MDESNINNDLVIESDTNLIDDKVLTFINNLGIDIDPEKLKVALCHKSYVFENDSADKLDLLKNMESFGKSLVNLIMCIRRFTDNNIPDKKLTNAISSDKQGICDLFDRNYNLKHHAIFGKGEMVNHKDVYHDIVYQVIFTIFEETNLCTIYEILNKLFITDNINIDYKSLIQEFAHKHKYPPVQYKIVKEDGPDHAKQFEVELKVMDQTVKAVGKSKKIAEKEAAKLYVLKNKLQVTDNAKIETSPIRIGDNWNVGAERRNQLAPLFVQLGIDQSQLPIYMLDACFTHKSYMFENRWAIGESFDNLSLLGAAVLNFAFDLELKNYYDTVCEELVGRHTFSRRRLLSTENLNKIFKPNWLPILKKGNGVLVLESKEAKSNIIQAIFGAIFINSFQKKVADPFDAISKVISKLIPIHEVSEIVNDVIIDYSSWLFAFKTSIGLELHQTKLKIEGPAHKQKFIVGLSLFHPLNSDMDFASEGLGGSRKEAKRHASKKILEHLKMHFNLSDYSIYSNSEMWQQTLSRLISIAIKPGAYQINNLDLIGGLCLKSWSDTAAINILNNLYDNMLFSEIRKVFKLWVKNNLSEKADLIISSHPNSSELIELILFGQDVHEDSIVHVALLEPEIEIEQQLEKNQNQQEADEVGESLILNSKEGSETIEEVMAKDQEAEIEKLIEEVKIDDETKLEGQETLKVDKNLEIEIETTIDRNDIQREIDKSIDRHRNQYSGSQVIPQNPIDNVNMERKIIKTVISNTSKTKGKNNTEKIQPHQSTKTTGSKTSKLCKIHSRIFRFASEQCSYCGEKLKNYNRIFSVNHKTETKYIESTVKCCLVCNICGLTDIGIIKLRENGFLPQFYQGSPTFFQSTVLTKALSSENIIQISLQEQVSAIVEKIEEDEPLDLDEIVNVPTKRHRVITPETLTKKLELNNRIGLAGEKYVLEWEKGYLEKIGRSDLAKQIIWEAQRNCAAGYDILSYNPDGTPKYIEVKSTSGNKMSFEISANEWEWAKYLGRQYSIYRVFNVFGTPYIEKFDDPIDLYQKDKIKLTPTSFRATLF